MPITTSSENMTGAVNVSDSPIRTTIDERANEAYSPSTLVSLTKETRNTESHDDFASSHTSDEATTFPSTSSEATEDEASAGTRVTAAPMIISTSVTEINDDLMSTFNIANNSLKTPTTQRIGPNLTSSDKFPPKKQRSKAPQFSPPTPPPPPQPPPTSTTSMLVFDKTLILTPSALYPSEHSPEATWSLQTNLTMQVTSSQSPGDISKHSQTAYEPLSSVSPTTRHRQTKLYTAKPLDLSVTPSNDLSSTWTQSASGFSIASTLFSSHMQRVFFTSAAPKISSSPVTLKNEKNEITSITDIYSPLSRYESSSESTASLIENTTTKLTLDVPKIQLTSPPSGGSAVPLLTRPFKLLESLLSTQSSFQEYQKTNSSIQTLFSTSKPTLYDVFASNESIGETVTGSWIERDSLAEKGVTPSKDIFLQRSTLTEMLRKSSRESSNSITSTATSLIRIPLQHSKDNVNPQDISSNLQSVFPTSHISQKPPNSVTEFTDTAVNFPATAMPILTTIVFLIRAVSNSVNRKDNPTMQQSITTTEPNFRENTAETKMKNAKSESQSSEAFGKVLEDLLVTKSENKNMHNTKIHNKVTVNFKEPNTSSFSTPQTKIITTLLENSFSADLEASREARMTGSIFSTGLHAQISDNKLEATKTALAKKIHNTTVSLKRGKPTLYSSSTTNKGTSMFGMTETISVANGNFQNEIPTTIASKSSETTFIQEMTMHNTKSARATDIPTATEASRISSTDSFYDKSRPVFTTPITVSIKTESERSGNEESRRPFMHASTTVKLNSNSDILPSTPKQEMLVTASSKITKDSSSTVSRQIVSSSVALPTMKSMKTAVTKTTATTNNPLRTDRNSVATSKINGTIQNDTMATTTSIQTAPSFRQTTLQKNTPSPVIDKIKISTHSKRIVESRALFDKSTPMILATPTGQNTAPVNPTSAATSMLLHRPSTMVPWIVYRTTPNTRKAAIATSTPRSSTTMEPITITPTVERSVPTSGTPGNRSNRVGHSVSSNI
ncbi:hypothetical protein PoB_000495300 [Plakobranchus ocellatus]|uniref:Uncharacterized protein n=1 Tax=Plakobranchus ocellatus TaxID=259542 RepID=A0AAV3Y7P6_9GAST|nr:hypothetical protein PoB_000495300 [Plakobranchus ocellatus]